MRACVFQLKRNSLVIISYFKYLIFYYCLEILIDQMTLIYGMSMMVDLKKSVKFSTLFIHCANISC